MKQLILFISLFAVCITTFSQELRITEIMYNPANSDSQWEWIELYNSGTEIADLSGYVVDDNSGAIYTEANIPSGSISPGKSVVLFNASALTEQEFRQAWGEVDLIPVTRWSGLNNGGDTIGIWKSFEEYSGDNQTQNNVIEQVVYGADGDTWPEDDGSASIYLTDLEADNTNGTNWALSTIGVSTPLFIAYASTPIEIDGATDIGSPGSSNSLDTEKPLVICPEDIDMASDVDNCGATFPFLIPTGTDNVTEELEFIGIRNDGLELTDIYPVGLTTITWTAIDEAGNVSDPCDQIILITDGAAPTISCPDMIEIESEDGNAIAVNIQPATASDNCEGELTLGWSRSDEKELQDPFPIGTTTIIWTATDTSNNVAECIQTVTVTVAPSIENDITSFSVPNQLGATIFDEENKTIRVVVSFGTSLEALIPTIEISEGATILPESGIAQDFSNAVVYTVTAQDGSEQLWTINIEVAPDTDDPIINCVEDIAIENDQGECGAIVDFEIVFSDNDPKSVLQLSQESGTLFPVGKTEVVATVTDSSGNSASCNFNITVEDTSPPELVCKNASVTLDENGNALILISDLYETLSDNCEVESITTEKLSFTEADLGENEVVLIAKDVNDMITSCTTTVTVLPFVETTMSIHSFVFIDAETNEELFEIEDGMRIDVNTLPSLNLNVRANVIGTVESILFDLKGIQSVSRTENESPYALFGDFPTGEYNGNDFSLGSYRLSATPFSVDNLEGERGETSEINFEFFETVPPKPVLEITSFTLVNADTNEDIVELTEGGQVDISLLKTTNLDIRVNTSDEVESIQLHLTGELQTSRTENILPYALFGDFPSGDYNGAEWTAGFYEIVAIPFSEDGLNGVQGDTLSINFELIDLAPPLSIIGFTLVNADTNEDIMDIVDGTQIEMESLPTSNLDIRANTTEDIESVRFSLSGEKALSRTENVAPYALFGDFPVGIYKGAILLAGQYSLSALGFSQDNLTGEMGEPLSITFELIDQEASGQQSALFKAYPNPASDQVTLNLNTPERISMIYLYDALGREIATFNGNKAVSTAGYKLDVSSIPNGIYYLKSYTESGELYQKQIMIKK